MIKIRKLKLVDIILNKLMIGDYEIMMTLISLFTLFTFLASLAKLGTILSIDNKLFENLESGWDKTREPGNPTPSQLGTSRNDFGILRKDFEISRNVFPKSFREIPKSFREVPSWLGVGFPGSRVFSLDKQLQGSVDYCYYVFCNL